jgi:hypothetical protein
MARRCAHRPSTQNFIALALALAAKMVIVMWFAVNQLSRKDVRMKIPTLFHAYQ